MKKCYEGVLVFAGMFFNVIINVIVFVSMKRGYRGVLGTGKNVWGL